MLTSDAPQNHSYASLTSDQLLKLLQKKDQEIAELRALIESSTTYEVKEIRTHALQLQNDIQRIDFELKNFIKKTLRRDQERIKSISDLHKIILEKGLLNKLKAFLKPRLGVLQQYNSDKTPVLPKFYKKTPSLKNPPKISIVTPSFNQGQFLERTILSIVGQNYPNLEYVIQDNVSSDNSVQIIKQYLQHLTYWESQKDTGQSNAINKAFSHTSGDIMAYLNSDDILLTGALHYVANYFNKHPHVDVIYGHRILIDEHDLEVGRWVLPRHNSTVLTWVDYIPQETLFWRRSIWDKVGGKIDESFKFAMDWDLLLRFKDAGAKFMRLPRYLGAFRVHSQQKTSTEIDAAGSKEMERLRVRCHGHLVTYKEIRKNIRHYLIQHVILNKLHRIGLITY